MIKLTRWNSHRAYPHGDPIWINEHFIGDMLALEGSAPNKEPYTWITMTYIGEQGSASNIHVQETPEQILSLIGAEHQSLLDWELMTKRNWNQ